MPIIWAVTPQGQRIAVDSSPTASGDIRIEVVATSYDRPIRAHSLNAVELAQLPRDVRARMLHARHIETCVATKPKKLPPIVITVNTMSGRRRGGGTT